MSEHKYLSGVHIRDMVENDRGRFPGLNFDSMLEDGYKILECESLYCCVSKNDYESFGRERICNVVYAEWSEFCEEYFLKIDWEKIANDPDFNKPLEIQVSFVKEIYGTNEMLFKGENGKHYLRLDNPREQCANWYSAFKHNGAWTDRTEIRPNVTFVMGDERETVTFSNWAGSGVWDGYNKAFSETGLRRSDRTVDSIVADATERSNEQETEGRCKTAELDFS